MRIVAGTHKGRKLFAPQGMDVRPTADRVREALFSILGPQIAGASVLDLFAGSGALGLEALSRGAARAVFVDRHPQALAAVRRNVAELGLGDRAVIIKADAALGAAPLRSAPGAPFSLIFLDPPYGRELALRGLELIVRLGLAAPDCLAVVEQSSKETLAPPPPWSISDERIYGQTRLTFLEYPAPGGEQASSD